MSLPDTAREILHTLLDRYEQPERQRVVRVRLNEREHAAYFSAHDAAPRRDTNGALNRLAAQGVLRLRWRKWEENNWLDAVDLVVEQADQLYLLLKRNPRNEQDNALTRLLDAQEPYSVWHKDLLEWLQSQIATHRSVAPFDRNDPQLNRDLFTLFAAVANLSSPTLERTLSVRLFGDSKRIEVLRGALLRVLRRHSPDAADFGDDDWALLQAHYLDRSPEYMPIAGPLELQTTHSQASTIDLAVFQPSVALSAAMLRISDVTTCAARAVVTIENATSFNELLAVRPPDLLAIYTGGFASPTLTRLLHAIHTLEPNLPFWHWGDLDAGGLRILAHLREQIGPVAPLAMNVAIFEHYRSYAQPLTPADRTALMALRTHSLLADCNPLIHALLSADKKLEQEALDSATVLAQIV